MTIIFYLYNLIGFFLLICFYIKFIWVFTCLVIFLYLKIIYNSFYRPVQMNFIEKKLYSGYMSIQFFLIDSSERVKEVYNSYFYYNKPLGASITEGDLPLGAILRKTLDELDYLSNKNFILYSLVHK